MANKLTNNQMQTTHIISIDPAFRKNGFGVVILDVRSKAVTVEKIGSYLAFLEWVITKRVHPLSDSMLWIVENSNLQQTYFSTKYGRGLTKAMNVGKNLGLSQCVCEYLEFQGCRLVQVSPKKKGNAYSELIAKADAKAMGWSLPKLSGDELAAYTMLTKLYGLRDKFKGGEILK